MLGGDFRSGYVVPILRGTASGTLCQRGACLNVDAIPAYHDHNWGIWRDVTWEWGAANGTWASLLYGGVLVAGETATEGTAPFFMALVDSLGVSQVYRFADVVVSGPPEAPDSLAIVAHRGRDSLDLRVTVLSSTATRDSVGRQFIQMLGRWRLRGTAGGALVADSGRGFFETWSGN